MTKKPGNRSNVVGSLDVRGGFPHIVQNTMLKRQRRRSMLTMMCSAAFIGMLLVRFLQSQQMIMPTIVRSFSFDTNATTVDPTMTGVPCGLIEHSINRHFDWAVPHFHAIFRRPRQRVSSLIIIHNHTTTALAATTTVPSIKPPQPSCLSLSQQQQQFFQSSIPYFVYTPNMLFGNSRYYLENLQNNSLDDDPNLDPRHQRVDARYEIDILEALLDHSSRVYDQDQAELFVVAVPFSTIYYDRGASKRTKDKNFLFRKIFWSLKIQSGWKRHKPHVVVVMTSHLFSCRYHIFAERLGLDRLYAKLENVTVARADDYFAARYAAEHQITSPRGFDSHFSVIHPVTKYTFSIGLGAHAKHVPLTKPNMEKFRNSIHFIFYRTRTTGSTCNSTAYRLAPIHNVTWSTLPQSSVGYDLPLEQWRHDMTHSKFCLVIRGDTPHSHSLFAAVKAGCIPVIISDWYLFYAPPFPATLNMWDFSIFLSEQEFMQHPQAVLASLQDLPDNVIQAKLEALEWAQRIMLLDHPESLFVPAFVQEALASFARPRSELLPNVNGTWCPDSCV